MRRLHGRPRMYYSKRCGLMDGLELIEEQQVEMIV
jgi:hypothetical protein